MKVRLALVGLLTLGGCYPKAGPPPEAPSPAAVASAQSRWPDATEASLNEGRALFVANCNRCHDYPEVRALEPKKLEHEAHRMAKDKAKLDDRQTDLLVRFVLTAREQSSPAR